MKEQLNNITRELEEITNKELTQQEKKENEKLYKRELKRAIKTILTEEIEKEQQKGQTLEAIYKNIIINYDIFIDIIIQDILNYKIIKMKTYKDHKGNEKKEEFVNYPFKDFDIAEDVDNQFYIILKNVINKYKLKTEVLKDDTIEELRQYFDSFYKKYGYTTARKALYKESSKKAIEQATKTRSKKTVQDNYFKILNECDRLYKIQHPEEVKTQTKTKTGTTKKNNRKKWIIGGLAIGFINGIKKASK